LEDLNSEDLDLEDVNLEDLNLEDLKFGNSNERKFLVQRCVQKRRS
jgi:hypothetical protein